MKASLIDEPFNSEFIKRTKEQMSFPRSKVVNKDLSADKKRKVSEGYKVTSKKKRVENVEDTLNSRIETISAASYVPGCLVFGYVLQVLPHHILVSLPGGVTGMVPETEAADRDVDYLGNSHRTGNVDVNDPVVCFVVGKSATDKQLRLSIRSSVVNRGITFKNLPIGYYLQGTIESKEDHGYVNESFYLQFYLNRFLNVILL